MGRIIPHTRALDMTLINVHMSVLLGLLIRIFLFYPGLVYGITSANFAVNHFSLLCACTCTD